MFLLIPFVSYGAEPNAGFIQGLWYSADIVFAETPTRIYVALRNNTPNDLTAVVHFADNGKKIGSSEVSALSGRLVEAWVDWTPTFGEHTITATVRDAELHIIGGENQSIDISAIIAEDTLIVDYDTDKDGTGNETDLDDDNDGVSDTDEKTRGSNPLVPNPKEKTLVEVVKKETPLKTNTETLSETESVRIRNGLEKYIDEGATHALLNNVTEKVASAKQSLDEYRTERNNDLYGEDSNATTTETTIGAYTDNATITRSKIETKNNFLSSFISGVSALLQNIYTFVLWVFSRALSYPALIQFALLIGILYTIYRIARSFGRRPRN